MEANLKFQLPEEREEYELAVNGPKLYSVLWEMDQFLRSELKYNNELSSSQYKTYQFIRDKLNEICMSKEVSL